MICVSTGSNGGFMYVSLSVIADLCQYIKNGDYEQKLEMKELEKQEQEQKRQKKLKMEQPLKYQQEQEQNRRECQSLKMGG